MSILPKVAQRTDGQTTPLQSKKFVAYLVAEITWKALAVLVLFWGKDSIPTQVWAILLAIILVAGFVEVGYILGQAALEKYIQVAQIAANPAASKNPLPKPDPQPDAQPKVDG